MAAPVTLTATTLEGQAIQLIEALTNAQVAAILAAGTAGGAVRRMVTANTVDAVGGVQTVSLSIPIGVEISGTGTAITAAVVY